MLSESAVGLADTIPVTLSIDILPYDVAMHAGGHHGI